MKNIESQKIYLKSVPESDAEEAFAIIGDPRVTKCMLMDPFPSVEFTRNFIRLVNSKKGKKDVYVYGIYEKTTDKLVGIINTVGTHNGNPVIAYGMNPVAWGKGYMTESLKAFVNILLEDGYSTIVIEATEDNTASNEVIKNAGFGFIGGRPESTGEDESEQVIINEYRLLKPNETQKAIAAAEKELQELMSVCEPFSDRLFRYRDETLPDMWDLNQFVYEDAAPTAEEIEQAIAFQKARGDSFVKLEGPFALPHKLRDLFGLEDGCCLTMALTEGNPRDWNRNTRITFKDLKHDDIEEDLLRLELDNYAAEYGEDFTRRKMAHWMETAHKDNGLNFYAAYLDGQIAGSIYSYRSGEYVLLDGLIVDPWARNRYVATSLMAEVISREGGIAILHADADDTPKDMYIKMGFRLADYTYESLRIL